MFKASIALQLEIGGSTRMSAVLVADLVAYNSK